MFLFSWYILPFSVNRANAPIEKRVIVAQLKKVESMILWSCCFGPVGTWWDKRGWGGVRIPPSPSRLHSNDLKASPYTPLLKCSPPLPKIHKSSGNSISKLWQLLRKSSLSINLPRSWYGNTISEYNACNIKASARGQHTLNNNEEICLGDNTRLI